MANMSTLGWRLSAALFGVLQALALILLGLILSRMDNFEARISNAEQRISKVEGQIQGGIIIPRNRPSVSP
jgi:hypothetical protein